MYRFTLREMFDELMPKLMGLSSIASISCVQKPRKPSANGRTKRTRCAIEGSDSYSSFIFDTRRLGIYHFLIPSLFRACW